MAIIQQPDAVSMSGNMKKFIVSSGGQISFTLSDGGTVLLDATYEPGVDGRATIDVRDIVESRLSYLISHHEFYEQPSIVKSFTATIDGVAVSFKVIRTGVSNLADTPSNWLRGNFLTWQPTNKQVTYYSPEWLTYYAQEACNIMLKATFPDDTVQNLNLGACEAGKAFTCNVQYAVISGLLGQKYPSYFDVWVENSFGSRLTYVQRYLYDEQRSELEQWFFFENSLGGIDTIRAYGDTDFESVHTHGISEIDEVASEYRVDTERFYNKNSGYLDEYERRWLLDFFPSRSKYVHYNGAIRKIVVTEDDAKYAVSDLPSSYTFRYRFSDDTAGLLNLIRNEDQIPEVITIPNLESPDFSLPPRLSEYPHVSLHGGVIIPAFDPNSSTPTVTTLAAIIAAAMGETIDNIPGSGSGGQLVNVLKTLDQSPATDNNVYSSLRTLMEIQKYVLVNLPKFISSTDLDTELTDENALSSLRVLLEIAKNNETFLEDLKEQFLSKVNPDTANGLITFLAGLSSEEVANLKKGGTFGDYTPGLLGSGAKVDEHGHGELDSLFIRKFLEVPELRYNKVNVYTGIRWDTFGGGLIESVEIDKDVSGNYLNTGVITLKLEEGEYGAIAEDDFCQGIFHNFSGTNDTVTEDQKNGNFRFSGFNTSYFRIIEILDSKNKSFRYQLRPIDDNWYQQNHPQPFMHFACYANPYNTDRQACVYTTTEYTIRLDNMTGWEYGEANIYGISGKLDGFKLGETIFQGHGNVIGNAYIYGHLQGIEEIIRENIHIGGKNLLREHAFQFGGKYWGGGIEWRDIDIDALIELLSSENGALIMTENNLLIEY